MLRYIALVWNRLDSQVSTRAQQMVAELTRSAAGWRTVLNVDGMFVLDQRLGEGGSIEKSYVLPNGAGVILGLLFDSRHETLGGTAVDVLDKRRSEVIRDTAGRSLLSQFWGRYIAFLNNPSTGTSSVLRGPSGELLCFTSEIDNIHVFFSRMEDAEYLPDLRISMNEHYLCSHLVFGDPDTGETGIEGISQVLSGECIQFAANGARTSTFYWNPLHVAVHEEAIEDPRAASLAIRHAVRGCVSSWASRFDGIATYLSGGLDSSIVAACLASSPTRPRVTAINFHSPGSDSDERGYARLVAAHLGLDLVEWPRCPQFDCSPLLTLPLTPFPASCFTELERGRSEMRLTHERNLSSIFNGIGGDWLFFQSARLPTAVDHAYRHGLRSSLISSIWHSAMIQRRSVWSVGRDVVRYGLAKQRWQLNVHQTNYTPPLLAPRVLEAALDAARYRHPVFKDDYPAPPGKLYQALLVTSGALPHYDPLQKSSDPVRVSPLRSQPIMEVCLRIPTDVLMWKGRDRAMARQAFSESLPSTIIARKSKGGMQEHLEAIVQQHAGFFSAFLLNGYLVSRRLLDADKLRNALASAPMRIGGHAVEILSYVTAEAWCRAVSRRYDGLTNHDGAIGNHPPVSFAFHTH